MRERRGRLVWAPSYSPDDRREVRKRPVAAAVKTQPESDAEAEVYLHMMDRIKEAQDLYNDSREMGEGKFEALHSARNEIKDAMRAKAEYEDVLDERPEVAEEPELASDPSLEELAVEELEIEELEEVDDESVDEEGLGDELEDEETLAERLWGDDPQLVLPED